MQANFENPEIANFLKRNHIAVIATADKESIPHAATVYYATDSRMNIFFLTKDGTTKSKNIENNPQAAIAIYEPESQRTLQTMGAVTRIEDKATKDRALRIMEKYAKETAKTSEIPISKLQAGDYVLYKISPQTYRLGDYKYGSHDYIFDTAIAPGESLDY